MTQAKGRSETPVTIYPPDGINDGSKDVASAGTAEQLTTTSTPCKMVNIFAKAGNTGNVFVGGVNVASTRGMVLEQARSTDWFAISNLNLIYVDVATGGDGVQYAFVT